MVLLLAVLLIGLEQISDRHSLQRDLPQPCDGLGGSSLTLAV